MSAQSPVLPDLGTLLQRFFVEYLLEQRRASPRTIAAYRDTFRLLLRYVERQLGTPPAALCLADLTCPLVLGFLADLENSRHNSVRTRNARLAAIRAFLHYVGLREPALLAVTQPILAIPMKRFERPLVGFLSREHIEALLAAPDPATWSGRRDRAMFTTLYNTGARVSELIGMRVADLSLAPAPSIRIRGKGRKERSVPLWQRTAVVLRHWVSTLPCVPEQPLFPNRAGGPLTRTSVAERLARAATPLTQRYPELARQRFSPHIIRHSTAMHLLQSGVLFRRLKRWIPVGSSRFVPLVKPLVRESIPGSRRAGVSPVDVEAFADRGRAGNLYLPISEKKGKGPRGDSRRAVAGAASIPNGAHQRGLR